MIMSGASLTRLETLSARRRTAWFQAYLRANGPITRLVERVARAGFERWSSPWTSR